MEHHSQSFLVVTLILLVQTQAYAQGTTTPLRTTFPEVGLALPKPKGFDKADAFHGFQQESTGASVMLSAIPGPFSEVTKGFDKPSLAKRGMELRSKKPVKFDSQTGFLLHVAQRAYGRQFLKWLVVFGDEKETKMVTATFPASHAESLSKPLRKVVLSVVVSKSNRETSPLPFSIQAVDGLLPVKKITAMGKVAMFTKNGKIPNTSPDDPMFVIAPSLGNVPIANPKQFSIQRLHRTAHTDIESVTSISKVKIDQLQGFEVIANGQDQDSKAELLVYQLMLFPPDGGYVLMTGLVGKTIGETYLPKFMQMAKTYKSTQP